MGCNVNSDEAFARSLAFELPNSNDASFAHELSLADQTARDAAIARSLATLGSGVDDALSHTHQPFGLAAQPSNSGMLYVAAEIGESEVEMLVDTGAQMSVISEPLANQLGLLSHLDRSRQGIANGVGQAKIEGHVKDIPVRLGHVEFPLTFSVLQTQQPLLILGLDQMRTYKCLVDIERHFLVFGGSGGVEVPFVTTSRASVTSPMDAVLIQARRAVDMLRSRNPSGASDTVDTLGRLLRNITKNPSQAKYRRLRGSNTRLQQDILAHPEAVELLRLVGFAPDGEDLVLPMGTPLNAVQKLTMRGGLFG